MAETTADILVDRLIGWNVHEIFGLPGDGINGIMEALRKRKDDIRFIHVRHEEAAAFMACGYAKYRGGSAYASPRRGRGASICSTDSMTPSSMASRSWRSPAIPSTISSTPIPARRGSRKTFHGRRRLQRAGHGPRPRRQCY